ncbi:MAG: glycosyltransferase family 2 protein [Actinomycetia bacterium]|nr:glycosyltransferase family 2 protein [Actinomycetes bacterium]
MARIAVLIPCYNEETTIEKVVSDYRGLAPEAEVYVFDNNSTDRTAQIARSAGAIVIDEYRQGKGNVVRSMFRTIDADVYLMVDGDDTYDAADTLALTQDVIEGRADMVIGDRLSSTYFAQNKRRGHNSGNRMVRWLINTILGSDIQDVMTGARALSKPFAKTYPTLETGFGIETEMTMHAVDKNFLITQHNVNYRNRPEGSVSKLDTMGDGFRVIKTILALFKDYRPLKFFSLISVLLLIASIGLFLLPFSEYLQTGYVTRFPTLIVATSLSIIALLSGACGIILDSIRKQTRILYEIELTRVHETLI